MFRLSCTACTLIVLLNLAGCLGGWGGGCSLGGELGQLSFTTANIRAEEYGSGCTDSPSYYFSVQPLAVGGEVTFDVEGYALGSSDTEVLVGDGDSGAFEAVGPGRVAVYAERPVGEHQTAVFEHPNTVPRSVVDFVWIETAEVHSTQLWVYSRSPVRDLVNDDQSPQFIPSDEGELTVVAPIWLQDAGETTLNSGDRYPPCQGASVLNSGYLLVTIPSRASGGDVPHTIACEDMSGTTTLTLAPVPSALDLSVTLTASATRGLGSQEDAVAVYASIASSSGTLVQAPFRWIIDTPGLIEIPVGDCAGRVSCGFVPVEKGWTGTGQVTLDVGLGVTETIVLTFEEPI